MPKVYDAKIMIEGILYDTNILLRKGDTRRAFRLLKHKIMEIERIDNDPWNKLVW